MWWLLLLLRLLLMVLRGQLLLLFCVAVIVVVAVVVIIVVVAAVIVVVAASVIEVAGCGRRTCIRISMGTAAVVGGVGVGVRGGGRSTCTSRPLRRGKRVRPALVLVLVRALVLSLRQNDRHSLVVQETINLSGGVF